MGQYTRTSCAGSLSLEFTAPSSSGGVPFTQLELLEATHRGLHKFVPRHHDEIEVEIGDPIYVQKEADDLWCEGIHSPENIPSHTDMFRFKKRVNLKQKLA